jgi:stage III sporulation protein AH
MFKIKRPAIIGLLVVLLVFTGYLNHELTQQAQRKASKDYKNYEVVKMDEMTEKENNMVVLDDDNIDDLVNIEEVDVVDSAKLTDTDNALETMSMEASMSSKNYFVEYRLSRDKLRASLVDRLDQIVNNDNTGVDTRTDAQKEMIKLGNISEKELQIEGLIKGKGYEDALVFLTDKDIKVVVSSLEFGEQDMVKILDIVKTETEYSMENIKIMKKQ